jgi:hypothetical protein
MGCPNQNATGGKCRCTYPGCPRSGNCCQCVAYHRERGEFTACFFTPAAEASFDRSWERLCRDRGL